MKNKIDIDHLKQTAVSALEESADLKITISKSNLIDDLIEMSEIISHAISKGKKLMLCGNGGSAADAQHLAAELLIRLRPHVNRESVPAITLFQDTSTITACGNDFGFDELFARVLSGIGGSGDVLLAITTSGNSENVIKCLKKANEMEITSFSFLGSGGGKCLNHSDKSILIPSNNTARIQEAHIACGHILMELIEERLLSQEIIKTI